MTGANEDVIDAHPTAVASEPDFGDVETLTLSTEEHGFTENRVDDRAREITAQFEARAARREAEAARRFFQGRVDGRSPHFAGPTGGYDHRPRPQHLSRSQSLEPQRGFSHMSREDAAVARLRQIAGGLQTPRGGQFSGRGEVSVVDDAAKGKLNWARQEAPSREDIEAIAADAYAALPKAFRDLCNGVAIMVRDFADDEVLDSLGVENEFDLLGLYEGIALTQASHDDVVKDFHRIFLYRRPILDYWLEHHESLGAVITHVLVHEIGHHFGLSDADMEAIERSAGA